MLKWRGYSNKHNSWEPKDNLQSEELLDEFEISSFKAIVGRLKCEFFRLVRVNKNKYKSWSSLTGIRKINNNVAYLVKFVGQIAHEVKTTNEMREKWPKETIDFLQNKIEWVHPVEKQKAVLSANDKRDRGTPQRILCDYYDTLKRDFDLKYLIFADVSQVGRQLLYWTNFEKSCDFLSENDAKNMCPALLIDYLESHLEIA